MFSINLSSRFLNSSGCRFFICMVSMPHAYTARAVGRKSATPQGPTSILSLHLRLSQSPCPSYPATRLCRRQSSAQASPSCGTFPLFSSDQLLRGFLGHSLCAVTPSASFFVVLSIHPKHIASSTASIYQNVLSSTGLPRLTTTQHSVSLSWFCISHSRSSFLDLTFSKLFSRPLNSFNFENNI